MSEGKDAWTDLLAVLEPDERVEWVVFGNWGGWSDKPETVFGEPDPAPVPIEKRGILLDAGDAEPFMKGWNFNRDLCYAVRIWTNRRIFWVTKYDGATSLNSASIHPQACMPDMPGG
jgi:hypothetical protein